MSNLSRWLIAGVSSLCLGLGACTGPDLEQAFTPDPRLQGQPGDRDDPSDLEEAPTTPADPTEPTTGTRERPVGRTEGERSGSASPQPGEPLALAKAFPRQAIPLYPERGPLQWQEIDAAAERGRVRWALETEGEAALAFYAATLTEAGWDIDDTSPAGTIAARQEPWQLEVEVTDRQLTLRYQPLEAAVAATETPEDTAEADAAADAPDEAAAAGSPPVVAVATETFDDLEAAPAPLQDPLQEVTALGFLTPIAPETETFAPDRPVSRRTFARWLLAAHERFWRDRPEWQIRPANAAGEPLFTDVPASDPDFTSIQSLAMAGIIPSPLSAEDGPTTFEPDAPLTRETLLAWKVPLDWHSGLPAATVADVRKAWGFQDAERIAAANRAAVAADHRSGEVANLRRLYGYTQLLQPQQPVTRAEAAAALWFFGPNVKSGRSAPQLLEEEPDSASERS